MLINFEYINLIVFLFCIVLITFILCLLTWLLMQKRYTAEKLSSYECGFEPFDDARKQVTISFYNFGLSFLLFDVEIILVLPGLMCFSFLNFYGRMIFYFFLFILVIGFIYELRQKFLTLTRNKWTDI